MKANQSNILSNDKAFAYIIPLTIAIVAGIALLVIGTFVVGEISSALEDTYATNLASGATDVEYWHNTTIVNTTRNVTISGGTAGQLAGSTTKFYILANGTFPIYYNLSVNGITVNDTSQLPASAGGYNHTLTALIAGGSVSNSDTYLNFTWDINSSQSQIYIRVYGNYYVSSDYRTSNENSTVSLLGNITDGFSDIVDIEVVVIIITALSMAIFTILAVGTRPSF